MVVNNLKVFYQVSLPLLQVLNPPSYFCAGCYRSSFLILLDPFILIQFV